MTSAFELRAISLEVMAKTLRISTKYEIVALCQWCKQQLLSRWPLKVVEMNTTAMPNAAGQSNNLGILFCLTDEVAEAICLAREFDIPEILPAAFYALAVQRWGNGGDGGRSHLILSRDDLRRLIIGREALHERLTAFLVNWDPHVSAKFFTLCRLCEPETKRWLPERLIPAPHSPYTSWLLHDLDRLSKDGWRGAYTCDRCEPALRYAVDQFVAHLQGAIPGYFML